jgi:hypothetical protein
MRVRFLRRTFLSALAFVLVGCVGDAPIAVVLENNSGRAIRSVVASYTGGVASFGPLGVDESRELGIRPTGDSHIELEITPAEGPTEHRVVDTYFGKGYRGKVRITLEANFAVRVSAASAP